MRKTRNDRPFYYCIQDAEYDIYDGNGNETGERIVTYESAVSMFANISPATGNAQEEQFGNLDSYDKVIVTHDMSCPIDENTVLFIDKNVEYGDYISISSSVSYAPPLYDYAVRRVAKSLNSISIAVKKVSTS